MIRLPAKIDIRQFKPVTLSEPSKSVEEFQTRQFCIRLKKHPALNSSIWGWGAFMGSLIYCWGAQTKWRSRSKLMQRWEESQLAKNQFFICKKIEIQRLMTKLDGIKRQTWRKEWFQPRVRKGAYKGSQHEKNAASIQLRLQPSFQKTTQADMWCSKKHPKCQNDHVPSLEAIVLKQKNTMTICPS